MVDCTPGGIGAKNKEVYAEKGVKGIFQGGEKHEQIGKSFNSFANYQDNWGSRLRKSGQLQHHWTLSNFKTNR